MSTSLHDLTGTRFGRLVVLHRYDPSGRYTKWMCQCDCGNLKPIHAQSLKRGETKSCGCFFKEETSKRFKGRTDRITHGMSRIPEYSVWASMIERCNNPKVKGYPNYGGRGIKVCDRWMTFANFIADMGRRPSAGLSVERDNNDGDYEPSNCYWATKETQLYNKRHTILIDYRGSQLTTLQASKLAGLSTNVIKARWFKGWPPEDIINRPKRGSAPYK